MSKTQLHDIYDNYAHDHLMRLSTAKTLLHKQQAFIENYRNDLPANRSARIIELGPGLGEIASLLVEHKDARHVRHPAQG